MHGLRVMDKIHYLRDRRECSRWSCLAAVDGSTGGATRLGMWTRPPALYSPWKEPGVSRVCVCGRRLDGLVHFPFVCRERGPGAVEGHEEAYSIRSTCTQPTIRSPTSSLLVAYLGFLYVVSSRPCLSACRKSTAPPERSAQSDHQRDPSRGISDISNRRARSA